MLGVIGSMDVAMLLLTVTTIISLLVVVQSLISEQSLRNALTAGLFLFAVSFLVLYFGTTFRFGTVVFTGSTSHTIFATEMIGQPLSELIPPPSNDYYYVLLTLLYAAGPVGYVVPILLNIVAFSCLVVVTYRLTNLIFGKDHARNAAAIIIAFPTVYLHIFATRPDMPSVALIIGVVYTMTLLKSLSHRRYLVYLAILILVILLLRPQVAALLLLVAVATATLRPVWETTTRERLVQTGMVSGVASLGFIAVLYVTNIWGVRSQGIGIALSRVLSYRVVNDGGLSAVVYGAPLPARSLLGLIPLFITPFPPWESFTASPSMAFYTVGGLAFFAFVPFAVVGLVETVRKTTENALALTMYTLGMTAVLVLVYGGFAVKFRLLLVPPLAIFASVGLEARKKYRYFVALCYAGYPALVVVYLFLIGAI
jgi:hypothetical protein